MLARRFSLRVSVSVRVSVTCYGLRVTSYVLRVSVSVTCSGLRVPCSVLRVRALAALV